MSRIARLGIFILSLLVVGFGQPSWVNLLALISYACGFALFGALLLQEEKAKNRFFLGTAWFTSVQLIQLSWAILHPFSYIYIIYFLVSLLFGAQYGLLSILMNKTELEKPWFSFQIAALWTIFEWMRLHIIEGLSWNPIGLTLASNDYAMQLASVGGIYLLSFWVMLTNMLGLQMMLLKKHRAYSLAYIFCLTFPFVFGFAVVSAIDESSKLKTLIIQTATPIEELLPLDTPREKIAFTLEEWRDILRIASQHLSQHHELIVLPEITVPHGTYWPIFSFREVELLFLSLFGEEGKRALPDLKTGSAMERSVGDWRVSNAYIAQALANVASSEVVIGLEDVDQDADGNYAAYNAAFHFLPQQQMQERYVKRVLVPFGEYIPYEWCRELAKGYGICGSMTPGEGAVVVRAGKVPMGLTICYEETYGDMMRDNKLKGAQLLVNLTNDGWYPHSRLPIQHSDHAKVRAVELGLPLIRSSNTGSSGAFDCFGRCLAIAHPEFPSFEPEPKALSVEVPLMNRDTLYAAFGDGFIIGIATLFLILSYRFY